MHRHFSSSASQYRYMNQLANALTVLAVVVLLLSAAVWVSRLPYFSIKTLIIEGMEQEALVAVTPSSVDATLAGQLQGNFFTIRLDEVQKLIENTPWVRSAQLKRVWPDTLQVKIEEQQPLAYWNESDMINTWGEPFAANEAILADEIVLPQLTGPANSERLVVQRYAEVAQWLSPLGLSIQQLHLSPRYAWEVVLSGGIRLHLGRDPAADIADFHGTSGAMHFAARLERFVQAWPALLERLDGRKLKSADLRYSNGFAVELAEPEITIH